MKVDEQRLKAARDLLNIELLYTRLTPILRKMVCDDMPPGHVTDKIMSCWVFRERCVEHSCRDANNTRSTMIFGKDMRTACATKVALAVLRWLILPQVIPAHNHRTALWKAHPCCEGRPAECPALPAVAIDDANPLRRRLKRNGAAIAAAYDVSRFGWRHVLRRQRWKQPEQLALGADICTIGQSWNAAAGVESSGKLNIDGKPPVDEFDGGCAGTEDRR